MNSSHNPASLPDVESGRAEPDPSIRPAGTGPTEQPAESDGGAGGVPSVADTDEAPMEPLPTTTSPPSCIQSRHKSPEVIARLKKLNQQKSERAKEAKEDAMPPWVEGRVYEWNGKVFDVKQEELLGEFLRGESSSTVKLKIIDMRNRECEGEFVKNPHENNRVYLTQEGARRIRLEFGGGKQGIYRVGDAMTMKVVRCNYPNKTVLRCRHGEEEMEVRCGIGDHYKFCVGMEVPVCMETVGVFVVKGRPRQKGRF